MISLSNNTYKTAMNQMKFSDGFEEIAASAMKKAAQRRQAKHYISKAVYAGISAAACVALSVLLIPAINAPKAELNPKVTQGASITQAADKNARPPQERRFVLSANYGGLSDSYKQPKAGKIIISNEVKSALNDSANKDAYFYVFINIVPPEQYKNALRDYEYNGRSIGEWEELTDLSDGTYPYSEYNGDHGGNITKEQWKQAQQEAKTLQAQTNYDAAGARYQAEVEPKLEKAKKDRENSELKRLKRLGYDVFMADTWEYYGAGSKKPYTVFAGLLTKSQLLEFDTDSECGYFIDWVRNGDGIVNWKN
jgi:hypothetical protein